MEALLLTCSTGGGHNAAAKALQAQFKKMGIHASLMDPYSLDSAHIAQDVGKGYTGLVKLSPDAFGLVYQIGKAYSVLQTKTAVHSPVYSVQKHIAHQLKRYLETHPVDVILCTHLYPAEMLTRLKNEGCDLPPTIFVGTDYTCIPLTAETALDYYVIPSPDVEEEYIAKGFARNKIVPIGIPISPDFQKDLSKEEAKKQLNLDPDTKYILVSGGSFGALGVDKVLRGSAKFMDSHPDYAFLVVCAKNEELKKHVEDLGTPRVIALGYTEQMHAYLKASEIFVGKPGGLSSTEACAAQIPFIIACPIPGCETANTRFFLSHRMALYARHPEKDLSRLLLELTHEKEREFLKKSQKEFINPRAAEEICRFAKKLAEDA